MARAVNQTVWRSRMEEMGMQLAAKAPIQWPRQMDVLPAMIRNRQKTTHRASHPEIAASRQMETGIRVSSQMPMATMESRLPQETRSQASDKAKAADRGRSRLKIKAKAGNQPPVETMAAGAIAAAIRSRQTTRLAMDHSAASRRRPAETLAAEIACGNWRCSWAVAATRAVWATMGQSQGMNM